MKIDNLDESLRDALQAEVTTEAFCLDGLESRIVTEIDDRLPKRGPLDFLRRLFAPTRGARIGQFAMLGATAVIFLMMGTFLADRVPGFNRTPSTPERMVATGHAGNEILFVMPATSAHNVSVVGSFNNWEATPLADDNGDDIWTVSIPLPPGRYEYAFVVDGRWWGQDPLADGYVRSFGEYNSVRYVGQVGDDA
jgi:hypothetical protein